MPSLIAQRQVILAKIESTYNTDPTPGATDAILVESPSSSLEGANMVDRPAVRPSQGQLQQVFADTLQTISFDVEIKGAGAAYSASVKPEVDVLLRACGMTTTLVTTSGSESITYKPISTPSSQESITIYHYFDGMRQILTGCRGTFDLNLETHNSGKISFTFTGHVATPTDTALVTPTYDSTIPPPVINGAFTIDSYAATIQSLAMSINNEIVMPKSLSASDGYGEIQITKRDVNGSFDPELELVATEAFDANWRSGASMALATGDIGSTQYNKYNVTAPAVYYRELNLGERDGILTYDISFGATESSGDDEIAIAFD